MNKYCLVYLVFNLTLVFLAAAEAKNYDNNLVYANKSLDYDPYTNRTIRILPNVFGLTQNEIEQLFMIEVEKGRNTALSDKQLYKIYSDFYVNVKRTKMSELDPKVRMLAGSGSETGAGANSLDLVSSNRQPLMANQLNVQSSPGSRVIDASSKIGLSVSKLLTNDLVFNKQFDLDPVGVLANFQAPNGICPFKVNLVCNATDKFQSFDGSCNNLASPWLGKAETPYKRYEQPTYDDHLSTSRSKSVNGDQLPNPRVISRLLFNENFQFDNVITHITPMFGQFLAHDITSASVSSDSSGRIVDCPCGSPDPACMSVPMPSNENIMRMSCMRFTRSSAAFPTFDCRLGHREQLNLLTSFIDCTQMYGPNAQRSRELRTLQGGQLKTSFGSNGRPLLPTAQDGACRDTDATRKCFAAGEGRTNENLGLTSVQTLFMREHNRVAQQLAMVNPSWNDDRLFGETRKIIIGMMQHIVYNEWLPVIIGWNNAGVFDLVPLSTKSYYSGYNPGLNPSLSNEFATAAFRFGHTLVRSNLNRADGTGNSRGSVSLDSIIFRPVEAYNAAAGGLDSILLGLISEPASKFDTNFANVLQNHLFEVVLSDGSAIAIDLAATNINRGRDHGIATYNTMREKCGLRKAQSFDDLQDSVSPSTIQLLQNAYASVDDIDLYVGGLSETPVTGGVVGPTFACVISNQFKDLKRGDRFYYENGPSPSAFTLDQLSEIKKASMSRIICNNFDITEIQPNAFILPQESLSNNKVSCSWLPSPDFSKWRQ